MTQNDEEIIDEIILEIHDYGETLKSINNKLVMLRKNLKQNSSKDEERHNE